MSTNESEDLLSGVRLLLADDHEDFGQLVQAFLTPRGVSVDVAADGVEALRLSAEMPYDLVIVDIQMPEMDGYELTAKLRARGFGGPIIAITAHAMAPHLEQARAAGCSEVHTKPISLPALRDALCRCLVKKADLVSLI